MAPGPAGARGDSRARPVPTGIATRQSCASDEKRAPCSLPALRRSYIRKGTRIAVISKATHRDTTLEVREEALPFGSQNHRLDCEIESLSLPQSRDRKSVV